MQEHFWNLFFCTLLTSVEVNDQHAVCVAKNIKIFEQISYYRDFGCIFWTYKQF